MEHGGGKPNTLCGLGFDPFPLALGGLGLGPFPFVLGGLGLGSFSLTLVPNLQLFLGSRGLIPFPLPWAPSPWDSSFSSSRWVPAEEAELTGEEQEVGDEEIMVLT